MFLDRTKALPSCARRLALNPAVRQVFLRGREDPSGVTRRRRRQMRGNRRSRLLGPHHSGLGGGDLKEVSDPMHSKRRSRKLPNTVLLSVAFRLLYHGSYDCGEIRGNHGYRGSVGSFCEEERARRFGPRQRIYVARVASAICCTNIFDFTVGYAAVKLTFRCRRRGVRLARWSGRLSGR